MTQEKFEAYENVRESGLTNMFAVNEVMRLADQMFDTTLSKADVMDIMKNYSEYAKKFL